MAAITWDELLQESSRIHTTRVRQQRLGKDTVIEREDAHMTVVRLPDGRYATVVPTRLHEPGFYVRAHTSKVEDALLRSPGSLRIFKAWVDAGEVERDDGD